MDIWSKDKRSNVMSRIKSKNTKPELLLRSALHKEGFRYRIHINDLPGKPDIVMPKYKTVIFVNGCFWHYHKKCTDGRIPKSNTIFWEEKISHNVEKDEVNYGYCRKLGWKVLVVWECEIEKDLNEVVNQIKRVCNFKSTIS